MPEIVGTVTQAAPRFIDRRDGTGQFPLYEVWIDGQGPWVARKDVFGQAERLLNQRVQAIVRDEQKGQYINHYLDFVAPANGTVQTNPAAQAMQYQPHQPTQPGPAPQPVQTASEVMQQSRQAEDAKERETRISIHRQKATDVATKLGVDNPIDYWLNVTVLFDYYETGNVPSEMLARTLAPQAPQQNAAAYRPYQEQPSAHDMSSYPADPGSQLPPPEDSDIPF